MDNAEQNLLKTVAEALTNHGLKAAVAPLPKRTKAGRQPDAVLHFQHGGHKTTRVVEIKRHLVPATLGAVEALLKQYEDKVLLVTDYVTPQLADRLRERDVEFADAAGNAYIQTDKVLIWTKGHRPAARRLEQQPTGRAFEPTGLKVTFALLCNPERVALPYRTLAQEAGVAHGTVGWAMADLAKRGFVVQLRGRRQPRRLAQVERLLTQWAEAYARVLRPRLLLARYRRPDTAAPLEFGRPGKLMLGGEPAAARITGYLKPGTFTLYGDAPDNRWVLENRLVADPAGNIELLLRFWRFHTPEENDGLAPLPLIYADLLAIGDARTIETAQLVQRKILDRLER